MPEEERSRILLLLPAPTTLAQFLLLDDSISEFVEFCGGATVSSSFPPVFDGWWIDQTQNPPVNDANVLIFGDALQERNAPALVTSKRQEKCGFEPTDRMTRREQVSVELRWVNDGVIRVRDLRTSL